MFFSKNMPFTVLSAAVVVVAALLLQAHAAASGLSLLKVGVYNIHGGVGTDGTTDLARIGRVLKSAAPEGIGLNEVNRYWVGDDRTRCWRTK